MASYSGGGSSGGGFSSGYRLGGVALKTGGGTSGTTGPLGLRCGRGRGLAATLGNADGTGALLGTGSGKAALTALLGAGNGSGSLGDQACLSAIAASALAPSSTATTP